MDNENNILGFGSLDFTPDWAKKDAGVTVGRTRPVRETQEAERRGDKPPRKGPFSPDRDRDRDRGRKPFAKFRPEAERARPPEFDVTVLPETKALGTVMRKLQQDYHAYKLKDLAYFFLDNPSSVLLKIVPKKEEGDAQRQKAQPFFQCRSCSFASVSEQDVIAHILASHLSEYFDTKEIDAEPPKGNFNCVAKCGLSGVLLGPPNIHEFNSIVREMIRTRYPGMSESEYRSHIVMLRDSESIEAWRGQAVKKTLYFRKGAAEGEPGMTREQAEGQFRRSMLPSMIDTPKTLMITADAALKSPYRPLASAASAALEAERRAPYKMCFALRGAFHHRKMNFFRTNDSKGQEFVCGHELKTFDSAHAIPELARIADFIAANPCLPKAEIAKTPDDERQLFWLASTGHVVAFTNGVFSAVEKYPKYGPQWQKKKAAKEENPDKPETPETTESPENQEQPETPETPATAEPTEMQEETRNEDSAKLVE